MSGHRFNAIECPDEPTSFSLRAPTTRGFIKLTDEVGWGEGKEHLKTVTLIGKQNVGKSRLFNRFVRNEWPS